MDTKRRILTVSGLLLMMAAMAFASIKEADRNLAAFKATRAKGEPDDAAYVALSGAYTGYADELRGSKQGSPEWQRAKAGLKDVFPYLREAAYHYAGKDDQDKVLDFASDYVDLALLPGMGDEQLQATPGYSVLANLAAINIYNRGDYQKALRYFQAYLSTGDVRNREMGFEGLASSYYELRNYDNSLYVASRGAESYPDNWNILVIGIESADRAGNYVKMGEMLDLALRLRPTHPGLLEYKGKVLEREGRYGEAAAVYGNLRAGNESSLDYTCHEAFNLYNEGLEMMRGGERMQEGKQVLLKAVPLLESAFANAGYAANIAHALAVCHSLTDNAEGLRDINRRLVAMQLPEVAENEIPAPETQYMPSVSLAPNVAAAPEVRYMSDVETDIPTTQTTRPNTYVVVIGNEGYKYFADVDYARRDAETFSDYCRQTLGVPPGNVRERHDATLSEIKEPLRYLAEKTRMNPGEIDIIFYYAGHGIPDVTRGRGLLLPSDATGTDVESCIGVDDLCSMLGEMPAKSVTVFLDACFSGAARSNEMLFKERFVEYEVEDVVTMGNVVVFAATAANQTAMGYDAKKHGLFTYFLLKNLKESKGDITLGQLGANLAREVDNAALDTKNKHQTPTVKADDALGDEWKSRKL